MGSKAMFKCGNCGEIYEHDGDAADCCQPAVYDVWECTACHVIHGSEAEAEACHPDVPAMPTPEELEAAGQQRLFQ